MQIERYRIALSVQAEHDPLWKSPARGALMHGLLMGEVKAEALHSGVSSLRPYTQYLQNCEFGQYVWTINVLDNSEAAPLLNWIEQIPKELYLSRHDTIFSVTAVNLTNSITYSEFLQQSLAEVPPKFCTLEFLTPLAFKKNTQNYFVWPDPRLIAQSALNRWNKFSPVGRFEDPMILDDIASSVNPNMFSLHSRRVAMDKTTIIGSVGKVSFHAQNNFAIRQVFNLCCSYSEFCGLGIKTAMGLGATAFYPGEVHGKKSKRLSDTITNVH